MLNLFNYNNKIAAPIEPINLDELLTMKDLIKRPLDVLAWLKGLSDTQQIIYNGVFKNGNTLLHATIFAANRQKCQLTDLKLISPEHFNLISFLLDNGANINAQEPSKSFTPLMFAGRFLLTDVFKLLLENGANLSLRSTETNPNSKEPDHRTVEEMMPNIEDTIRKPIILDMITDYSNDNGLKCNLL